MTKGLNKVMLIGNLGADPETRYTANGTAITSVRIATTESWSDKQSGERSQKTQWHRVKLFGRLAEIAGEHLKKGRQVYIEGRLETSKYADKEGVERYATDVVAAEMQMLGSTAPGVGSTVSSIGRRPEASKRSRAAPTRAQATGTHGQSQPVEEDDIPF